MLLVQPMTSLSFNVNLSVDKPEWVRKFMEASCSERAIMFSQVMDAFNDGELSVELSFSEPVANERKDI